MLLVGGCTALPRPAVERIRQADEAYQVRRFGEAEQLLTSVVEAHPDHPDVGEALYLRGLCRLHTNQIVKSQEDFRRALRVTHRDALIDLLHTQLGILAFNEGRYRSAAVYFAQAYEHLPDQTPKDRVGLQYGVALQRLRRFEEARPVLEDVAARFPGSSYAAAAQRKAGWTRDYFSIQCGAYSDIGRAHQHAESLAGRGINAIAFPENVGMSTLHVVRVGRYGSYGAAQRALTDVHRVEPAAFIVP
jgi:tetratricopeptide (TPR) repeat protein